MPILSVNSSISKISGVDVPEIKELSDLIKVTEKPDSFEVNSGILIEFYKDSQGYDRILTPDGEVMVESQRWIVEYLSNNKWKQIGTPYDVNVEETESEVKVNRFYTDYSNTDYKTVQHFEPGTYPKTDIELNSGEDRIYRIVWNLDGINNELVSYGDNYVNFTGPNDWICFDWSDAFNQFGDISSYEVSDQANGKKLEIVFNVGLVKQGEYLVLDPTIIDSFTNLTAATFWDKMEDNHPSDSALDSSSGQTFNATLGGFVLNRADFWLRKVGNPTGLANASLFAMTGTFGVNGSPIGVALSNSTTQLDVSTITGGGGWVNFTFPGDFTMVFNTTYCIVVKAPTIASGLINAANYFEMRKDGTFPTTLHPGNAFFYRGTSGGWVGSLGDMIFVVWGVTPFLNNTGVTATPIISRNTEGFVNATISNLGGLVALDTVDIQVNTTGDAETFTFRYDVGSDTFSEVSDSSSIVILNTVNSSTTALDANTSRINFLFNMTDGTSGLCDVRVSSSSLAGLNDVDLFTNVFEFSFFNWVEEVYNFINSAFSQLAGIDNYMTLITAQITALSVWFESSLTRIVELFVQQFTVINEVYNFFLTWTTNMFGIVLDFSRFYQSILDGTNPLIQPFVTLGNIWDLIGYDIWIDAAPLFIFIIWISSVGSRGKQIVGGELQVFINDINTSISLISYFTGIFIYVVETVIARVYGLFDAVIPGILTG